MSQARTQNVMLTINAALLAAVLWTQLSGSAMLSSTAQAQNPPAGGIPNAGGQRERMIDELAAIRESVDGLRKSIEGGKMKISIANIDELKAATRPADADKGK